MKNAHLPAAPTLTCDHNAAMNGIGVSVTDYAGLTKREMFAMAAMQGILTSETDDWRHKEENSLAASAIKYADALLTELERTK